MNIHHQATTSALLWASLFGCGDDGAPKSNPPTSTVDDSGDSDGTDDSATPDSGTPDTGTSPPLPTVTYTARALTPCADPDARTTLGPMQTPDADAGWDALVPDARWRGAEGIVVGDFDADDHDDVFFPGLPPYLMRADGAGGHIAAHDSLPLAVPDKPFGAVAADVEGDGDLDLFLYGIVETSNRLWVNDGTGHFTDGTEAAGLAGTGDSAGAASFGDLDGDGDLDLVVGNYRNDEGPNPPEAGRPSLLFENDGTGHFIDRSDMLNKSAMDGYTLVVAITDLVGDPTPDIYMINDFGMSTYPNVLLRNDGDWTFSDQSRETHTDLGINGMGLGIGDLNDDGAPDMVVSGWSRKSHHLLMSDGYGGWYETAVALDLVEDTEGDSHVAWGTELADLDNDTDLDVVTTFGPADCSVISCDQLDNPEVQPNTMHLNEEGMFVASGEAWNLDHGGIGRGLALADLNEDGFLDVLQRHLYEPPLIRLSRCGSAHWSRVELRSEGPNTHGIGALVTLDAGGKTQRRWVMAGGTGLAGSGPGWVQFGLQDSETVEQITIRWPNGETSSHADLPTDQVLRFTQTIP